MCSFSNITWCRCIKALCFFKGGLKKICALHDLEVMGKSVIQVIAMWKALAEFLLWWLCDVSLHWWFLIVFVVIVLVPQIGRSWKLWLVLENGHVHLAVKTTPQANVEFLDFVGVKDVTTGWPAVSNWSYCELTNEWSRVSTCCSTFSYVVLLGVQGGCNAQQNIISGTVNAICGAYSPLFWCYFKMYWMGHDFLLWNILYVL